MLPVNSAPAKVTGLERVNLFFSAKALSLKGFFTSGNPNAFAAVFRVDPANRSLTKIATTEVRNDSCDPTWPTCITVDYNFEVLEEYVVKVYHHHGAYALTEDLSKHTFLGECGFSIISLMRAPSQMLSLVLGSLDKGKIEVRGEVQTNTRDNFVVTFSASNLVNKEGFFSTSDPFLEISRLNEDGSWSAIWRNQYIPKTLNPKWAQCKIPMAQLCNGDIDRPLRLVVFDHEKSGRHVFMGQAETNVRNLMSGANVPVIEPEKTKKPNYKNSGVLNPGKCFIENNPTFADFVTGGCEISLIVAIDFTGSNGDPSQPNSLHYIDPAGRMNQYQEVITSVGHILEQYDSDQMYPVFGFGARVRLADGTHSPAQHCFPVYGGGTEVHGISGILQAYNDAIRNVMFSGPTLFAPMIHTSAQIAASKPCNQDRQNYQILLIITDGVINDLELTKAALVEASYQPVSIIIVGVGNADFTEMNALDSDGKLLTVNNKSAARDIVQFVAYRDLMGKGSQALAQHVLAEVPTQVLQFMQQNNITPHKKST